MFSDCTVCFSPCFTRCYLCEKMCHLICSNSDCKSCTYIPTPKELLLSTRGADIICVDCWRTKSVICNTCCERECNKCISQCKTCDWIFCNICWIMNSYCCEECFCEICINCANETNMKTKLCKDCYILKTRKRKIIHINHSNSELDFSNKK